MLQPVLPSIQACALSKARLCSLQLVLSSPWVSGSGRRDPEVHSGLQEGQMGMQPAHLGPRSLQVAIQTTYQGRPSEHKCPYCTYTSRLSSNLRRHVRTHTGEMPYSCANCDFRCKDASSMKRHQITHARRSLHPSQTTVDSASNI